MIRSRTGEPKNILTPDQLFGIIYDVKMGGYADLRPADTADGEKTARYDLFLKKRRTQSENDF